jgi:CheY-like chemotaxis protein
MENDDPKKDSGVSLVGKRLLIVEDDWLLQNLISTKLAPLRESGVLVDAAFDGPKAMEMATAHRPDAILLDIMLPGMTGFEFLDTIQKNDPTFIQIPVIVFTNLNGDEDRDTAKKLGVREFMYKADSTPGEIVEKLGQVLKEEAHDQ